MKIRPIVKNDIAFLSSVRGEFSDAWNENMLSSAFNAGNFYGFIAEETVNNTIAPVGFLTYSFNALFADLEDLFVVKDYRKKGVGKALVAEFIAETTRRGAKKLFLEVRESNLSAKNLYLSAGFKGISVRKKYYSDGENALVLIKEL